MGFPKVEDLKIGDSFQGTQPPVKRQRRGCMFTKFLWVPTFGQEGME